MIAWILILSTPWRTTISNPHHRTHEPIETWMSKYIHGAIDSPGYQDRQGGAVPIIGDIHEAIEESNYSAAG
jgi:hypothetical protein